MPPQNNQPPAPSTPPSSGQSFDPSSLTKNAKLMTTVKIFAIYVPILMVVNFIVSILASGFRYGFGYGFFTVPGLIMAIVWGIISGAIGGLIFYYIYDPVHNWVKRTPFLAKYIHNMFTLFWIPSLVCSIIGFIFGLFGLMALGTVVVGLAGAYGAASVGGAFIGVILSFIVNLIIYYFYAKFISAKLEPLYPW